MIARSLCPRISWACCASCTLMVLSSLKIEPLGREHSNITSWSENTFRPNSQSTPKKLSFWDLCRANGEKLCVYFGTFHIRAKVVDSLPGYTSGMARYRHNLSTRAKLSMRPSFSTAGTIRPLQSPVVGDCFLKRL